MPTNSPILSYDNHHSTFWADRFANFSVLAILSPILLTLVAFLCTVFLASEPAIEIIYKVLDILGLAIPLVGLSLAITSLALKTRFRKTAISGLIICTLLILLPVLAVIIRRSARISLRPPTVITSPPIPAPR